MRPIAVSTVKKKLWQKGKQSCLKYSLAGVGVLMDRLTPKSIGLDALEPFAIRGTADDRVHVELANAVYMPTQLRRGVYMSGATDGASWYAYVGGDDFRGFWYSPGRMHLVLAERGTTGCASDICCDVYLVAGMDLNAVSDRARLSRAALREQILRHDCTRVTLAGHSLGGTVAVFVASTSREDVKIDAAHAFNPGGIPNFTRYVSCLSAPSNIVVHHIQGDPISAGFLPVVQRRYSRRLGLECVNPHQLAHFM